MQEEAPSFENVPAGHILQLVESGEEYVKDKVSEFMNSIPDAQVNDDKTVVVLVNPNHEMKMQTPEYYAEPNWDELKRRFEESWKRAAYPHLFKDEEEILEKTKKTAGIIEENGNVVPSNGAIERAVETIDRETTQTRDISEDIEDEPEVASEEQEIEPNTGQRTFRRLLSKPRRK